MYFSIYLYIYIYIVEQVFILSEVMKTVLKCIIDSNLKYFTSTGEPVLELIHEEGVALATGD